MAKKSPIPPGAYVEVDVDLIDEGKLRKRLETKIRQAHKALMAYEQETGDNTCKSKVTLSITLARAKGTQNVIEMIYGVKLTTPEGTSVTLAKQGPDGQLLCQPAGTDAEDPSQQKIFDHSGRLIGTIDGETYVPGGRAKPSNPNP